jgi:uncharacterized protein YdeI (YjbR/CyaY-like superfamily)
MKPILKDYIYEASEVEKAGLKVNFKKTTEFIIPEEVQRVLCVVFAAEPLDPVTSILGGGDHVKNLIR